jgi:hypothetical protein
MSEPFSTADPIEYIKWSIKKKEFPPCIINFSAHPFNGVNERTGYNVKNKGMRLCSISDNLMAANGKSTF